MYLLSAGANPSLNCEFDGMNPFLAARSVGLTQVEVKLECLGAAPIPPLTYSKPWFWRLFRRNVT